MKNSSCSSYVKSILEGLLVLLGPPGAGKGTQARRIAAEYSVPQISTGELLRLHTERGTKLGMNVRSLIERGLLVGDDLMCDMVAERLAESDCARGSLLDGFPRTIGQAKWLDRYLDQHRSEHDKLSLMSFGVIRINVQEQELVRRLNGRRLCPSCGRIYNTRLRRGAAAQVCDVDGAELRIRGDDMQDLIHDRIRIYEQETLPVAEYYRERGQLYEVNGNRPVETVLFETMKIVKMFSRSIGTLRT